MKLFQSLLFTLTLYLVVCLCFAQDYDDYEGSDDGDYAGDEGSDDGGDYGASYDPYGGFGSLGLLGLTDGLLRRR